MGGIHIPQYRLIIFGEWVTGLLEHSVETGGVALNRKMLHFTKTCTQNDTYVVLGGVMVSVFALDPRLAGSLPAEGDKNPQHAFLEGGGV
jgi:hypothetical protein